MAVRKSTGGGGTRIGKAASGKKKPVVHDYGVDDSKKAKASARNIKGATGKPTIGYVKATKAQLAARKRKAK